VFVGFDLDLTLLDTRPGIAAACRALTARTGVPIDVELVVGRLGPPLAHELAHWFPATEVPAAVTLYRRLYAEHAITPSRPLPGARAAVAAVQAAGGRAVVVTAKHARLARMHLDHLGFAVDGVVGEAWEDGKSVAVRGALAYVGDHVADVRAAVRAGTRAVAVTTGPCDAGELRAAGADDVLPDLTGFPDLFAAIWQGSRLERTLPGD